MSAARDVALAFSVVNGFPLALQADDALHIGDGETPPSVPRIDLGRLVGGPGASGPDRRFVILGPRLVAVLLGQQVSVRRVPIEALQPLPALVASAGAAFGCVGLVQESDHYAFLLDATRLEGLAAESNREHGSL